MELNGRITGVKGKEVTLLLDEEIDIQQAVRITDGDMLVSAVVRDKRSITRPQQKLIHALFSDAAAYTGDPFDWWERLLKTMFATEVGEEEISLATNKMTQVRAGAFIEYILDFLLSEKIPFRFQEYHLAGDVSRILFLYIKYRVCFACGEGHGDYAHYEAVGMGRNRKTIDHSKNRFMCLCRKHHNQQHQEGIESFMKKHHIAPIKLTPEQVEEFGIGKNMHKELEGETDERK